MTPQEISILGQLANKYTESSITLCINKLGGSSKTPLILLKWLCARQADLIGDPNNKLLDTLFDDINQGFGRLPG